MKCLRWEESHAAKSNESCPNRRCDTTAPARKAREEFGVKPNPDFHDAKLLDELTFVVSRAAAEIMRVRSLPAASRQKSDGTPVTAADEASEAVLLEGLSRLLPGIPVISEEAGGAAAVAASTFVLVDPLDGTREFIAGRDEFTINLAVVSDGSPLAGWIAAPAHQRIWRGIVGQGAERLHVAPGAPPAEAKSVTIRTRKADSGSLIAMVSRSHADAATEAFLARFPSIRKIASGSAIKFCRLAEGGADIYPRLAPTMEWDVAAGDALLRAAGGQVTDPGGAPLGYGRSGRLPIPAFIAWGDPARINESNAPLP
jgi:3'(2'), 5'-bisphosphate nucleotidase